MQAIVRGWQPAPKSMPHWLSLVQQPKACVLPIWPGILTFRSGTGQRSSVFGIVRQALVPDLRPHVLLKLSLQQASPSTPFGTVHCLLPQATPFGASLPAFSCDDLSEPEPPSSPPQAASKPTSATAKATLLRIIDLSLSQMTQAPTHALLSCDVGPRCTCRIAVVDARIGI